MRIFLADTEKETLVEDLALLNIKRIIEDSTMVSVVGRGVVKITYLGPQLIAPYQPAGVVGSDSSMSGASIAVLSAGAGTVAIFLLIMFAWRRTFHKAGADLLLYDRSAGPQDNTSLYHGGGDSDDENGPNSPFSEMLPSAYRYSENMSILSGHGLSALTEMTESDSSQQSLKLSLSGFSDEAANDSFPPNRVAIRKRKDDGRVVNNRALDISRSVEEESFSDEESESHAADGCARGLSDCSAATTQLLLGISSPTRNNTSQEDEAMLFL